MMFVTKCPCDECVPLIGCAGIKQVYTTDLDSNKVKHDISYLRFDKLSGVQKFIVSADDKSMNIHKYSTVVWSFSSFFIFMDK